MNHSHPLSRQQHKPRPRGRNRGRINQQIIQVGLLAVCGLFGCQTSNPGPSPGRGDPYPAPLNDPQISVLSPELAHWLVFQPAVVVNDGRRPLQVEVPVRNLTSRKYLIDFRILFYNADGVELDPVMGWQMVAFEPKQVQRLKAGALSTDAVTYRLEVKWAR